MKTKKFLQWPVGKTAQDIQDDIFRRMSAERKIELWSQFLKLTKDLSGGGEKVYFSSAEDLILMKLSWYKISPSDRQLDDVKSILKISGDKLDARYLNKWAKKLGVLKILNRLKNK